MCGFTCVCDVNTCVYLSVCVYMYVSYVCERVCGVYVYQHKQVASKIQLLNVFLMRSQIKMEESFL